MIITNIFTGIQNLLDNGYTRGSFIIYNANSVTSANRSELEGTQLLAFDGFIKLGYNNSVQLPQQPLENRGFTQDSILDNPFTLSLLAVVSQQIGSLYDLENDLEGDIVSTLEYAGKSDQLVNIFRKSPLFSAYINMHLDTWNYEQSPDKTALFANMNFKEIRTSYIPSINNINSSNGLNTSNNFSSTESSNPANATNIDNGLINTTVPTSNVSNLQLATGVIFF